MRRLGVIVLIILLMSSTMASAALRSDRIAVRGEIVSTDTYRGTVTVKVGDERMTFQVLKGVSPSLSQGDRVLVIYKKGTTQATMVRKTKVR